MNEIATSHLTSHLSHLTTASMKRTHQRDVDAQAATNETATEDGGVQFYDLPEGCLSAIVSFTTPRDACRIEAVSQILRRAAESDSVWEGFLPSNYRSIVAMSEEGASLLLDCASKKKLYLCLADRPLLIDGDTKSFGLEKSSGKICLMMSARCLSITWSSTPRYWRWTPMRESRFPEVAELIDVCWLEIRGRIKTSLLTPGTRYAAYLVFKLTERAYGFEDHAEALVAISDSGVTNTTRKYVYIDSEAARRRRLAIVPLLPRGLFNQELGMVVPGDGTGNGGEQEQEQVGMLDWLYEPPERDIKCPEHRGDGWMEIEIGMFFNECGRDEVELSVLEVKRGNWKSGLIVQGIEVRPATNVTS